MHPNLTAYEDFEIFSPESKDEISRYRESKIEGVQKNISFIKEHFAGKINVLEIGSGNSKFLYALEQNNLLEEGYGIDVSKSRVEFANYWKEDLKIKNVFNINKDVLKLDFEIFPQFDLIYCVDLAFQFLSPVEENSDTILLNKCLQKLKENGKIILELDDHSSIIRKMDNNQIKVWQEFEEPDPWEYLLWNCLYNEEEKFLNIEKTFIKRDLTEVSKNKVSLKIYSKHDIVKLLKERNFYNIKIFDHWEKSGDTDLDEFIVMGEKYDK
tara:strand:+ start:1054 stop:1860 length:807 start_codon:yes stop_codon:yes gene_type:complete